MMKKLDHFFRMLERRWQPIALSAICICLTFAVIAAMQTHSVAAFTSGDWGVHFGAMGAPPTGNVSPSELAQYNAYFMGNTEEKKVYLTFDAGFENGYMDQILMVLKEQEVQATFFLVEHYLKQEPDLVRRMAEEGHIVANHTASHPDMSKLTTPEALLAELVSVEELYKEITGKDMLKLYRPPQGKYSLTNLQHAKELGYTTVFWSLAYVDWNVNHQPSAESALQKLNARLHNGAVILLHSTSKTNAEILGTLLKQWKNQGYTFGSLEEFMPKPTVLENS